MDYTQFVNELKNSHSDTIEILSDKLVAWLTTAGTTTFNLSSGDFTLQNIPNVQAGNFSAIAGENLSIGNPVKMINDGGVVKLKKLIESKVYTPSTATNIQIGTSFYNATYDKIVSAFSYLDSTFKVGVSIGTLHSDFSTTWLTTVNVSTDVPLDVQILEVADDYFIVFWRIAGDIKYKICKIESATTISISSEQNLSLSDCVNFVLSYSEEFDKVLVTYQLDSNAGGSEYRKLSYGLYTYDASKMTLEGSDDLEEVATADYTTKIILLNSFRVCYNSDDNVFHVVWCFMVDADKSYAKHNTILASSGVMGSEQVVRSHEIALSYFYHSRGIFYDNVKKNLFLVFGLYTATSTTLNVSTFSISSLQLNFIQNSVIREYSPNLNSPTNYFYPPYLGGVKYDDNTGKIYGMYHEEGITNSILLEVKSIENYNYILEKESIVMPSDVGLGTLLLDGKILFGANNLLYVKTFDERYLFIGVVLENKLSGVSTLISLRGYVATIPGLTPGMVYYLQNDCTLNVSTSSYPVGVALSTTQLKLF